MNLKEKSPDINKRDPFIDSLKGIAILLVVMGHVIVTMYTEKQAETNIIFRICYSFHMPLFMTISGYLTGMWGGLLSGT